MKKLFTVTLLVLSLFAFNVVSKADACTGILMDITVAEFRGTESQYGFSMPDEAVVVTQDNGYVSISDVLSEEDLSNSTTSKINLRYCGTITTTLYTNYKINNLQNTLPALYGGYTWSLYSGNTVSVVTPQNPYPNTAYFFLRRN